MARFAHMRAALFEQGGPLSLLVRLAVILQILSLNLLIEAGGGRESRMPVIIVFILMHVQVGWAKRRK